MVCTQGISHKEGTKWVPAGETKWVECRPQYAEADVKIMTIRSINSKTTHKRTNTKSAVYLRFPEGTREGAYVAKNEGHSGIKPCTRSVA